MITVNTMPMTTSNARPKNVPCGSWSVEKEPESPAIPVWSESIPTNISPKPATERASAAFLPCVTNLAIAPRPTNGKASLPMPNFSPTSATSQPVLVVPSVAPITRPIACEKLRIPALTKPIVASVVALED